MSSLASRRPFREYVWDFRFDPHTNVVETHINRIRTKVDKPFDLPLILTGRGAGYCMQAQT